MDLGQAICQFRDRAGVKGGGDDIEWKSLVSVIEVISDNVAKVQCVVENQEKAIDDPCEIQGVCVQVSVDWPLLGLFSSHWTI